jgi:SpoVK/Ycf46/Vps4 family AAA+-type ATPase
VRGRTVEPRTELGRTDEAERRALASERKTWEASRIYSETDRKDDDVSFDFSEVGSRSRSPFAAAADKLALEMELREPFDSTVPAKKETGNRVERAAATRVSEIVAKAGGGKAFEGETLGIGGLDDVLAQVKRRVWIPLAAPPQLLEELGINPVRGLLLYGLPGCGKSLLARKLGQLLSPMRPITLVSGPEILDKFVGCVLER